MMRIITDITDYTISEAQTDSEMLHDYLTEHVVNDDYTVTFTNLTLSAEHERMRKDYDYEISLMRREYEDYKSKTAKVQEFLNNEIAELKTQRDELINNTKELINNVTDMTHTKDHFYCENCNGTGVRASGEICEDCGGYGTTGKWWADDAPGSLHD
jgi:hypothetical protein